MDRRWFDLFASVPVRPELRQGATVVAPFSFLDLPRLVIRRLAQNALSADAELAALDRDLDGVAVLDAAFEDLRRQRVLQAALDHPLERPGAVDQIGRAHV